MPYFHSIQIFIPPSVLRLVILFSTSSNVLQASPECCRARKIPRTSWLCHGLGVIPEIKLPEFLTAWCLYNNRNPPPQSQLKDLQSTDPKCAFFVFTYSYESGYLQLFLSTYKKSPLYLLQLYETNFTSLHFAAICKISPFLFASPLLEELNIGATSYWLSKTNPLAHVKPLLCSGENILAAMEIICS